MRESQRRHQHCSSSAPPPPPPPQTPRTAEIALRGIAPVKRPPRNPTRVDNPHPSHTNRTGPPSWLRVRCWWAGGLGVGWLVGHSTPGEHHSTTPQLSRKPVVRSPGAQLHALRPPAGRHCDPYAIFPKSRVPACVCVRVRKEKEERYHRTVSSSCHQPSPPTQVLVPRMRISERGGDGRGMLVPSRRVVNNASTRYNFARRPPSAKRPPLHSAASISPRPLLARVVSVLTCWRVCGSARLRDGLRTLRNATLLCGCHSQTQPSQLSNPHPA